VEQFYAWKSCAAGGVMDLLAKESDAMLALEREWREASNENR
jgi:hypothetical protein